MQTPEQLQSSLKAVKSAKKDFWLSVFTDGGHFYLTITQDQALEAVAEGMCAQINCFGTCMVNQKFSANPEG